MSCCWFDRVDVVVSFYCRVLLRCESVVLVSVRDASYFDVLDSLLLRVAMVVIDC